MTPRLPTPGSDDNVWGDVLNEYLNVVHAADGTLKAGSVHTDALVDGVVTNAKAGSDLLGDIASKYVKPSGGIPPSDLDMAAVAADPALVTAFGGTQAAPPPWLGANFGFFGDSITNYGEGYPYYAALLSQGAFRAAQIKSFPGESSTQLVARLDPGIINATPVPTACLILCGANDAQGAVPLATYRGNVEAMVNGLLNAGISPVLGTVTPNNNDGADTHVRTYNAWLMRYAEMQRIPLVDFYTALVNQTTGDWKAPYDAGDGLHPSNAGNKVMGQLVFDTLKGFLIPRPYLLQPTAGAPNLVSNSNFLADSNFDGLADELSASPAAGFGYTLVTDAAGFKWQRITLSGGGSSRRQVLGATSTVSSGKLAVGDRLRFAARVRTGQSNAAGSTTGSTLQITCYRAGYSGVTLNTILTSGAGAMSQQIDGVVSGEFTVPSQTEIVQWAHLVGPADGTYDVAQPTLYNLTALGID